MLRMAFSMPTVSLRIEITGLPALVVQEALEEILQVERVSSLIPTSTVSPAASPSLAGALITTLLAPASM